MNWVHLAQPSSRINYQTVQTKNLYRTLFFFRLKYSLKILPPTNTHRLNAIDLCYGFFYVTLSLLLQKFYSLLLLLLAVKLWNLWNKMEYEMLILCVFQHSTKLNSRNWNKIKRCKFFLYFKVLLCRILWNKIVK